MQDLSLNMTNKKDLTNLKIFGILIVAVASVLVIAAVPSQNAIATIIQDSADVDVDEAAEAENATTTVGRDINQTSNGNMTETNSTT